jgi:hypothetical protein
MFTPTTKFADRRSNYFHWRLCRNTEATYIPKLAPHGRHNLATWPENAAVGTLQHD